MKPFARSVWMAPAASTAVIRRESATPAPRRGRRSGTRSVRAAGRTARSRGRGRLGHPELIHEDLRLLGVELPNLHLDLGRQRLDLRVVAMCVTGGEVGDDLMRAVRCPLSPMLSSTRTGFSVRKRKPRMRFCSSSPSSMSRIGLPSLAPRSASEHCQLALVGLALGGVPVAPVVESFSMRFSITDRSASTNSRSSCSRSRQASTEPSGCGTDGSSKARTTCSSSSAARSRAVGRPGSPMPLSRRPRVAARAGPT